jgi:hypothetical protein
MEVAMEVFLIILRMLFALYVGWCLLWIVAVWISARSCEPAEHFYQQVPRERHRERGFRDSEILDREFPDPRMVEGTHRPLRHMFYRKQAAGAKRRKAILLYRDGWVGILWSLLVGHDTVREEVSDDVRR